MGSETFELKRFGWATPDRLEIDGRFIGLDDPPEAEPVLVLHGAERTHRLPAVAADALDAAAEHWHAAFVWQETPTAFDTAQLELGDELLVDLPEPRRDAESSADMLDVRHRGGQQRLRLQSELLRVRSELSEANARLERAEQELARAREDLEAERASRAQDAEQFRADLAQAQQAAEEALAEAAAETSTLRVRVAGLHGAGAEAERLRNRLSTIREILDEDAEERRGAGGGA
jgi:multidrug resistance efflux pump